MSVEGLKAALKAINIMVEVEAGNLAKSNVPGAKGTRASIESNELIPSGKGNLPGPGVALTATHTDFFQGSTEQTKSSTDLAIQGNGFFTLLDATGDIYLTRQGNFHFDNSGYLVNNQGLFLASFDPATNQLVRTDKLTLGGAGSPMDTVQFNAYGVLINETQGLKEGKSLALSNLSNPEGLLQSKYGPEIYHVTSASGDLILSPAGENNIGFVQGFSLEGANTSTPESLIGLSFWQKNFSTTVSAVKAFMSTWDDLNNTVK